MLGSSPTPFNRRRDDLSQTLEFADHVRTAIDTHGWAVVSDTTPQGPVAYTVGRAAHGHPEFLIYGLRPAVAETVLNALTMRADTHGTPEAFSPVAGVLVGMDLMLVPVDDTRTHLPTANLFYALDAPVTGLQVVFPDHEGRWPWDAGSHLADMPLLNVSAAR